ncbi:unnamed protein product, partial [Discosporangium mesarthrocarpum]
MVGGEGRGMMGGGGGSSRKPWMERERHRDRDLSRYAVRDERDRGRERARPGSDELPCERSRLSGPGALGSRADDPEPHGRGFGGRRMGSMRPEGFGTSGRGVGGDAGVGRGDDSRGPSSRHQSLTPPSPSRGFGSGGGGGTLGPPTGDAALLSKLPRSRGPGYSEGSSPPLVWEDSTVADLGRPRARVTGGGGGDFHDTHQPHQHLHQHLHSSHHHSHQQEQSLLPPPQLPMSSGGQFGGGASLSPSSCNRRPPG